MTAVAAIPVRHDAILLTGDNPGTYATKEQALRALFTELRRRRILGSSPLALCVALASYVAGLLM